MTELWELLPGWLKWVLLVSGWVLAAVQNLWRNLPDNLYVLGLRLRRARPVSSGTIKWSDKPMIKWGEDAKAAAMKDEVGIDSESTQDRVLNA